MSKYTINTVDLETSKADNINFDSLVITDNLGGNAYLLHNNQKKDRVVYSFTKSRSDFTSGGAKPYKQKGTGRARLGTNRSPLKVGGSVIFGPKPRIVKRKTNKRFFIDTLRQLLLTKLSTSSVFKNGGGVEKASSFARLLSQDKTYLYILDITQSDDLHLFSRIKNIPNIYFNNVNSVVVEDLLRCNEVIYSTASFQQLFIEKDGPKQ
ncbi:MAG: uL4 family ribosomal protein [Candidatus Marinamargulisbacteria bacterium]